MTRTPGGPVLALDTSTEVGSVAVGTDDQVYAELVLRVSGGHSAALLPAIDAALRSASLAPSDLRAVVVGAGPGSFTGLRIGAATAKGIAYALGLPLWAYSGLLAAAVGGWGAQRSICALFDARRGDVYAASYRLGPAASEGEVEEVFAPKALSVEEVVTCFRGAEPPLFIGNGALVHRSELERELNAVVAPPHLCIPRASSLLWLLHVDPERGHVANAADWEPGYVRASGAERIAARADGGTGDIR